MTDAKTNELSPMWTRMIGILDALEKSLLPNLIGLVQGYDTIGYRWSRESGSSDQLTDEKWGDHATLPETSSVLQTGICADRTIGSEGGAKWEMVCEGTNHTGISCWFGIVRESASYKNDENYDRNDIVFVCIEDYQFWVDGGLVVPRVESLVGGVCRRIREDKYVSVVFHPNLAEGKLWATLNGSLHQRLVYEGADLQHFRPFARITHASSCILRHAIS